MQRHSWTARVVFVVACLVALDVAWAAVALCGFPRVVPFPPVYRALVAVTHVVIPSWREAGGGLLLGLATGLGLDLLLAWTLFVLAAVNAAGLPCPRRDPMTPQRRRAWLGWALTGAGCLAVVDGLATLMCLVSALRQPFNPELRPSWPSILVQAAIDALALLGVSFDVFTPAVDTVLLLISLCTTVLLPGLLFLVAWRLRRRPAPPA